MSICFRFKWGGFPTITNDGYYPIGRQNSQEKLRRIVDFLKDKFVPVKPKPWRQIE